MSALEDFQPGDCFLDNFRIEGMLGRGGMGEVYLATDVWMEREVAVKLIQRKYADLPDFVERFRRETKALAKLEHRNIVRVYSAGRAPDGRLYMIMERLHGLSLRQIIKTAQGLDLVSAIHYGIQIAEGVSIAHAKGLMHRDIKPENILVGPGGHVWVLDFGLAKSTASTVHTDERKEIGTTRYISPEQIHGQRIDERADLYAIGIVLYEMLAGRHPYPSVDEDGGIGEPEILAAHLYAAPKPLVEIIPDCPEPIWELVARCLAKDREARHPSAEALATDLRAALRVIAPPMPSSPEAPPSYSFTTQSQLRAPLESASAWSPAAKASAKSGAFPAPPLLALQPAETLRWSAVVLILAGVGVAVAAAGLVFFVWFQQRPAALSAAVQPVETETETATALAADEPPPPTGGAAGEAEVDAAPVASAALPEAPVASAALPEEPAGSAALPVAPVVRPTRAVIGAAKQVPAAPPPRLAAAKPTAAPSATVEAPSATAEAPAPRARVGRLWLDADPAPAKPASTRSTPVPPFDKAKGVKR